MFLHGYPLNGFQWRGALERLSVHRRCIAPDLMGLGYTLTAADQDLSPRAQTDMLAALLASLSIDNVDIVANDSGGTIAQLFLSQHAGRVRTALLTDCDVQENSPPTALGPFMELARTGRAANEWLSPQLADKALARSNKGLGQAYTNPEHFTDEAIECYFAPLLSSPMRKAQFDQYAVSFEPNPLPAIESALKSSAVPVRIVWGTNDPLFNVSWAHWLDRTLPQSRGIHFVEGAKLFFPEEMPDLIAAEARRLWGVA
ncbi:MAG TPA: alpha/beta hydrolase [Steroidobacteraceae bacterium]|nr:alpha/beta hydrolase [Steroidobacteraceae bacterium]